MTLEHRLTQLECRAGNKSQLSVKEMTDDELARIITGDPDAKASDLTDDELARSSQSPACQLNKPKLDLFRET
jgi:hypothetical protein